ncbi:MAG: 30S ribosomal protein S6 [Bergeyella sp.]|nr:30S ribosomal protein S6 [Bergeyella sp.]
MQKHFFSRGKLLLTSEYLVLDGALALAVPTKRGQFLSYKDERSSCEVIFWKAYCQEEKWLEAQIDFTSWTVMKTNDPPSARFVLQILKNVHTLSGARYFRRGFSYFFSTRLEFPRNYGWGSSSTLINNLSLCFGVDPFMLNEISLGGSAYDIAVAQSQSSILYRLKSREREIKKVRFSPEFSSELLLVHLARKQDSREGIRLYRSRPPSLFLLEEMSAITQKVLHTSDINTFSDLMMHHENLLSSFLKIPSVGEKFFSGIPVFVKSLGAWGGDFVLTRKFEGCEKWFSERGFSSVLAWDDVVY